MFEEEKCFKCGRDSNQVKLLDAIYENEMVKICEECSTLEEVPVIKKPTTSQLNEIVRPRSVYERLARAAGLWDKKKADNMTSEEEAIKRIKEGRIRGESQNVRTIPYLPRRSEPINLIDNFYWYIMRARRARGLSQKQLAMEIGENEIVIKMIEQGSLPGDGDRLIKKLEQFLRISLRKAESGEKTSYSLRGGSGVREPVRILNFDREAIRNLSIEDLRRLRADIKGKESKSEMIGSDIEIIDEKE